MLGELEKLIRPDLADRWSLKTTRIVHYSEVDTLQKEYDLKMRMVRRLDNRAGFPVDYRVETRTPIRNGLLWSSARHCVEVTVYSPMFDGRYWPRKVVPVSDGHLYENKEWYAEKDRIREKKIKAIIEQHRREKAGVGEID